MLRCVQGGNRFPTPAQVSSAVLNTDATSLPGGNRFPTPAQVSRTHANALKRLFG